MKLRKRLTKVIGTVGPSLVRQLTESPELYEYLDALRFNFSHIRDHEELKKMEPLIVKAKERRQCLIADLQGPKFRIGELASEPVELRRGDEVKLVLSSSAERANEIPVPHKEVLSSLKEGSMIFLNDGRMRLRVLKVRDGEALAKVEVGGTLYSRKGINLSGVHIPITPLTDKDLKDLELISRYEFHFIAMSFVQRANDVKILRRKIEELWSTPEWRPAIIAKIETSSALNELPQIVDVSDAIMIARGDLAVEAEPENVPILQKEIISLSRSKFKPVIVATQVLSSMVDSPFPRRAELTDIANAILDGADAIMLSEETAIGNYVPEVLKVLHSVALRTESYKHFKVEVSDYMPKEIRRGYEAMASAALGIYEQLKRRNAVLFAVYTHRGNPFEAVARFRPQAPIILYTPNQKVYKLGLLSWATLPQLKSFSNAWEFELYLKTELKRELEDRGTKVIALFRDNHLIVL